MSRRHGSQHRAHRCPEDKSYGKWRACTIEPVLLPLRHRPPPLSPPEVYPRLEEESALGRRGEPHLRPRSGGAPEREQGTFLPPGFSLAAVHKPLMAMASRAADLGPQGAGSADVVHRRSYLLVRGVFPDQESNPRVLHWQAFFTTARLGKPKCSCRHCRELSAPADPAAGSVPLPSPQAQNCCHPRCAVTLKHEEAAGRAQGHTTCEQQNQSFRPDLGSSPHGPGNWTQTDSGP
ncbi:unnamed protein product [Rangifer tarandus platyrhynchus]|uniref:Uncharacterized protein n=1 Tax=Rangifer tarandus platyrhynchus TaxID=3082113 RepID=A0AC59ZKW5_RANTA